MLLINILKDIRKQIMSIKIKFWQKRNRILFKMKGVKYGQNLKVYNKMYLQIKKGEMTIGDNFTLTSGDCINPLCRNICACIFIKGGGVIDIGNNVGMSSPSLRIQNNLVIGNNVHIGGNCIIIDSDAHQIDYEKRRKGKGEVKSAPIIIEDDAWLGANVIVLKGVTIGARSIIGAGSVVTKSIPADCIAAGNPCKIIKRIISNE